MAMQDAVLDRMFAALGDGTRRAVVARLARGPATVGELASAHDMALPSFLGHLKKLEAAGLIETEKRGRVRTCRLAENALQPVQHWMDERRQDWPARLDRFDAYATALHGEKPDGS